MSADSPGVPELLKLYRIKPDKRLGQNFLIDRTALTRVVEASAVGPGDEVLEVGAGLGSLTRLLAETCRRVVAIELDERLISPLKDQITGYENVQIIHGDILGIDPGALFDPPGYAVVATIPYYLTSALIRHLLEADRRPGLLALTVQREVAERICEQPGSLSLLALSVQVYGKPDIRWRIPAGAFYPAPKVDSAVVRISLYPSPRVPESMLPTFFRLAKAGFSQKRKTLRNALAGGMRWSKDEATDYLLAAGIDPHRRAQTVSIDEWGALSTRVADRQ